MWLCLTPNPREAEAAAHPQDRASSALCTSGSLWCRNRWHGHPQGRGGPGVSAPQSPSGNHRASSSWSTPPMGTTQSFHIELAGRERRKRGRVTSPQAQNAPGELLPPALYLGLRPRGQMSPERNPRGWSWGKVSPGSSPAHSPWPALCLGTPCPQYPRDSPGLLHSMVPLAAAEPSGQVR